MTQPQGCCEDVSDSSPAQGAENISNPTCLKYYNTKTSLPETISSYKDKVQVLCLSAITSYEYN